METKRNAELKKLGNMKVTMIVIVADSLWTVPERLVRGQEELEIGGRAEINQTATLLRSIRVQRKDLVTGGNSQPFIFQ